MIYEYKCPNCSEVNEFWMKMSDPHPEKCPSCNKNGDLERVISKTSFALKGSGWYSSGYGNKKPASETKTSEKDASKTKKTHDHQPKESTASKTEKTPVSTGSGKSQNES